MCLLVFSLHDHPRYDLVFAANRDEFHGRPTRDARFWEEDPSLLAGRDLQAGGTWMGITRRGRFAALTNYRGPDRSGNGEVSRGHLVRDFLQSPESDTRSWLEETDEEADRYDGFNLIAGSVCSLSWYSNVERRILPIEPGVHGLSNHLLDTPWPKVQKAKQALERRLREESPDPESLFELLLDSEPAPEAQLPETGLSPEMERMVSPVFIRSGEYGTRSSTVVLVDKKGSVIFEERRYEPDSETIAHRSRYDFELEGG